MNKTLKNALCCLALVGLTACGPLQESNALRDAAGGIFSNLTDRDSPVAEPGPALSREFIEAQDNNLMRISLVDREATGLVIEAGRNGSKVTWVSPDGMGFVFDRGLLAGTRGLGDDLMGADLAGVSASLNVGGSHLRTLDFLDGLDQIVRRVYQCETVRTRADPVTIFDRTYRTTIFEETCKSDDHNFKNTYWRDANGVIWQSRQWISADVGYLGYQRL